MKRSIIICLILLLGIYVNTSAQKPDRSNPPELPPPAKLNLPAIQEFSLSNGMRVVLLEKHEVPLIQLNVAVNAGTADDPSDKTGLVSMMTAMLMEGAAGKSALELADEIDFLGASISAYTDYHSSTIALYTPLSKFDAALQLLSNIVINPDFPSKELERKKKERLTQIMQWHDEPNAIASVAFSKLLFGEEHIYGKPSIGNENSISALSVDDIRNFHNKYFNANNSVIIAAGDISREELKNKLESVFGKWRKGEAEEKKFTNADQVDKRKIYLINKPGAPQSVITIGRIGVPRTVDDYSAILIMNTILGGSFTSRLNQNLREDKGYTYGASSYFRFRKAAGPFGASSSVQSDVTDKALFEFMKELKDIRETITASEISRAKNYIALGYPGEFQTVSSIAGELQELVEYGLSSEYFNNFIDYILKTPDNEIKNAARKYIDPEKMIIVVVGDREKIEGGIKELNLGEIVNLSIEDVLGEIPDIK